MKISNKFLLLSALLTLSLTACGREATVESSSNSEPASSQSSVESSKQESSSSEIVSSTVESSQLESTSSSSSTPVTYYDDTVPVFVLSGQSNMEGSTTYVSDKGDQWLRNAFDKLNDDYDLDLDISYFEDEDGNISNKAPGVENVLTSFFGFYPPSGPNGANSSNKQDKLAGKFVPTNVGMGNQERFMGPEIGMSMVFQEYASEERPIYLIKCAFSGSGFTNSAPNWSHNDTFSGYNANNNLYETYFEPFVRNNLALIEDTGMTPVIKGFLWHQGESDAGNNNYDKHLSGLVERFRTDFADYAPDEDGDNIAFVDGYIYDGPRSPYGADQDLNVNKLKQKVAEESDNNFVINTSYHHEDGQEKMELNINPDRGDVEGGVDNYHYKTYDCVRLGMAYANMIIENGFLD